MHLVELMTFFRVENSPNPKRQQVILAILDRVVGIQVPMNISGKPVV